MFFLLCLHHTKHIPLQGFSDLTRYLFNSSSYMYAWLIFTQCNMSRGTEQQSMGKRILSLLYKHIQMCVHVCMMCVLRLHLTLFHPDQCLCPSDPKLESRGLLPWLSLFETRGINLQGDGLGKRWRETGRDSV